MYSRQSVQCSRQCGRSVAALRGGDGGICYGDLGGPHFLGDSGMVVSLTVTGDRFCRATDKTYRLDTPSARAYLDDFVTLP